MLELEQTPAPGRKFFSAPDAGGIAGFNMQSRCPGLSWSTARLSHQPLVSHAFTKKTSCRATTAADKGTQAMSAVGGGADIAI